jgi:hypothetical protein
MESIPTEPNPKPRRLVGDGKGGRLMLAYQVERLTLAQEVDCSRLTQEEACRSWF